MAGERVPTKLASATWARIMGINPVHYGQVQIPDLQRAFCDQAWFQHEWQNSDRVGRDAIAEAIASAEREIEQALGYRLLPAWEVDEWQPTVRPSRPELFNLNSRDIRGFSQVASAKWGQMISGGIQQVDLIEAGVGIAYASTRAPASYLDEGTITVNTLIADPCEIGIYYPGHNGEKEWQIRPAEVSLSVGVATITFARELAILESEIEALVPEAVLGTDNGNFLTTVDVYRRFNDPQIQVQLMWEPVGGCSCGGDTCPSCSYSVQMGCLLLRDDPRISQLVYRPATWNETTLDFDPVALAVARQPDLVRFWYYAGLRDKAAFCATTRMDSGWERIVAYMAAARLDRPPCDCANKGIWDRWAKDLAFSGGAEELATYNLDSADLRSPFGTRAGEINAWRQVRRAGAPVGRAAIDA